MDSDAIPPSSPPHATLGNIPSSPFFESLSVALSPKSSSPPPLFSSDDSRESVDVTNYESPRIYKNKRKGAWWDSAESAHNTPEPKKSKISRNYDSGVYMMSDATDSVESLLPQHKSPFPLGTDDALEAPSPQPRQTVMIEAPYRSPTQSILHDRIRDGLEQNLEVYDFQDLYLQDGDIPRVGDLAAVIKDLPDPGQDLPVEGQYRSMVPSLYINLSCNLLRRLTPSLFNLRHLTTLILRNNVIRELPPHISRLENLAVLDLSLNHLRWLPFDVVRMLRPYGRLERLNAHGNPLLEHVEVRRLEMGWPMSPVRSFPEDNIFLESKRRDDLATRINHLYDFLSTSEDPEATVLSIRLLESCVDPMAVTRYEHHPRQTCRTPHRVAFIARTAVTYLDQAGRLLNNSPPLPRVEHQSFTIITETARGAFFEPREHKLGTPSSVWFSPPTTSRVPSLLTMSLHTALKRRQQDALDIQDIRNMVSDTLPPDAEGVFARASENDSGGYGEFRQCHACKKDYVVARAEWIEFWSVSSKQHVPFHVKVCSWGCVPPRMLKKPEKELAR